HPQLHSFPTRRSSDLYRKRSYFYCWAAACAHRPQGAIMREKVEAQGDVSDPAAGGLGTRGIRVLGWVAGERELPAEILSGALLRDRKSTRLNSSHVKI